MQKIMKKVTLFMLSFVMMLSVSVPTFAATKEYDYSLKVGDSKTGFATEKAGSSSFEKKFYVTQNFVARPSGSTRYFSYHPRYEGKQRANGLQLGETDFSKHYNTYYSGEAVAGRKYRLYCKFTGSGDTGEVNTTVTGRWTP